ncbi:MAG: 30S ribosomal protein S16 [Spirochaetia bacterium]|nr:30S ribosomal protein S16 [Spirochaetota bacterium]MCX8096459.1 30S ribosomal protein S16 [Spirochaetota bacterium]MDW8112737.1 30S ribosomal protein S16 [Spirochaetia bacterium]
MVRIRLMRFGAKHRPYYRIVVVDSRKRRDGAYVESLGHYAPMEGKKLYINQERYNYWISVGAQPSETVGKLYKRFSSSLK